MAGFKDEVPDFEELDGDFHTADVPSEMADAIAGLLHKFGEEQLHLRTVVNKLRAAAFLGPTTNNGPWLTDDLNEAMRKLANGKFPRFMDAISHVLGDIEFASDRSAFCEELNEVFEHFDFGYRLRDSGPSRWKLAKGVKRPAETAAPVRPPPPPPRPGPQPMVPTALRKALQSAALAPTHEEKSMSTLLGKTLIIHGHDDVARLQLKDLLHNDLGLPQPVVMGDKVIPGATLPEKFERLAGEVEFAIALLTPDDVGRAKKGGADQDRARQNVLVEIGWFWGRLGRERILLLVRDTVEFPSDLQGVEYHAFHSTPTELTEKVRKFFKAHGVKLA